MDDVLLVRKNVKMEGDVDGEWCGDNNLSNFLRVVAEVSVKSMEAGRAIMGSLVERALSRD